MKKASGGQTRAVVGVKCGDGEVAVGVRDEHRRAQLHLHERVPVKLGEENFARKRNGDEMKGRRGRNNKVERVVGGLVGYLREDVAGDEDREAGGVDGGGVGGGDAGEVVAVGVGEEAVALEGGGGGPRVHREGQTPRQLDRHLRSDGGGSPDSGVVWWVWWCELPPVSSHQSSSRDGICFVSVWIGGGRRVAGVFLFYFSLFSASVSVHSPSFCVNATFAQVFYASSTPRDIRTKISSRSYGHRLDTS